MHQALGTRGKHHLGSASFPAGASGRGSRLSACLFARSCVRGKVNSFSCHRPFLAFSRDKRPVVYCGGSMDVAWLVAYHIAYACLPTQENTCDTKCTGEGAGARRSNMCSLKWQLFLSRGEGHPSDVIF